MWKIVGGIGTVLSIVAYLTGITRDVKEIFKDDSPAVETSVTHEPKAEGANKKKTTNYPTAAKATSDTQTAGNSRFLRIERNDETRVYICSNGDRYETNSENETYDGHGTLHLNVGNGMKNEYVGEFKDFKPDGYGTMYYSNNSSLTGKWKAGKYIEK